MDFHSYLAKRNRVAPERLNVSPRLFMTFHRNMFETARKRFRGRFLDWYYGRRLAVGTFKGAEVAVLHSFVGSSAATMMLEEMIASDSRHVIEVGSCGGLPPKVQVGDLILADRAFVDEGTSAHYFEDARRFAPSRRLTDWVRRILEREGTPHRIGGVWTTDAPYRETRSKLVRFREQGAVCVNMESSALFAVCQYRRIEIASLQVVSDLAGENVWKPSFHEKIVASRSDLASRVAVDALAQFRT